MSPSSKLFIFFKAGGKPFLIPGHFEIKTNKAKTQVSLHNNTTSPPLKKKSVSFEKGEPVSQISCLKNNPNPECRETSFITDETLKLSF